MAQINSARKIANLTYNRINTFYLFCKIRYFIKFSGFYTPRFYTSAFFLYCISI